MLRVCIAALVAAIALTTAAAAAKDPPLPQAAGHRRVTVVARGLPTPTEFAVLAGRLFVAGYGDEQNTDVAGGVYILGGGKATRVPGSPRHVYGLAAAKNTLYLSTNRALLAWSGWNGTRFQKTRRRQDQGPLWKLQGPGCRARRAHLRGSGYHSPPAGTELQRLVGGRRSGNRFDHRHRNRDAPTVGASLRTRPRITSRLRSQPGQPRPAPPARLPPCDQAWRELRLSDLPGGATYVCDLLPAARGIPGPCLPHGDWAT